MSLLRDSVNLLIIIRHKMCMFNEAGALSNYSLLLCDNVILQNMTTYLARNDPDIVYGC